MNDKIKAVFSWSGGKDSALALQKVLEDNRFEVVSLLATVNADTKDSSIHKIPMELLEQQAERVNIPLFTLPLLKNIRNYSEAMTEAVEHFKQFGVTHFIFGDVYLEDVKRYREQLLNPLGITVELPLWGKTSKEVMEEFYLSGICAKIIVTDAEKLDEHYIGKVLNEALVENFEADIDPCGENGEYHTFVYDAPIFSRPIFSEIKETVKETYTFKLDSGEEKTSVFWQAVF